MRLVHRLASRITDLEALLIRSPQPVIVSISKELARVKRTLDATPQVGGAEGVVTLDGGSSGFDNDIDTTSPVVDEVVSRREIETLPLNGRNFLELALLIPGNAPAPNFEACHATSREIVR